MFNNTSIDLYIYMYEYLIYVRMKYSRQSNAGLLMVSNLHIPHKKTTTKAVRVYTV